MIPYNDENDYSDITSYDDLYVTRLNKVYNFCLYFINKMIFISIFTVKMIPYNDEITSFDDISDDDLCITEFKKMYKNYTDFVDNQNKRLKVVRSCYIDLMTEKFRGEANDIYNKYVEFIKDTIAVSKSKIVNMCYLHGNKVFLTDNGKLYIEHKGINKLIKNRVVCFKLMKSKIKFQTEDGFLFVFYLEYDMMNVESDSREEFPIGFYN